MKAAKPSFDFLDFEEAERLLRGADPEWQPMIILAIKTGLWMRELRAPRWEDEEKMEAPGVEPVWRDSKTKEKPQS